MTAPPSHGPPLTNSGHTPGHQKFFLNLECFVTGCIFFFTRGFKTTPVIYIFESLSSSPSSELRPPADVCRGGDEGRSWGATRTRATGGVQVSDKEGSSWQEPWIHPKLGPGGSHKSPFLLFMVHQKRLHQRRKETFNFLLDLCSEWMMGTTLGYRHDKF